MTALACVLGAFLVLGCPEREENAMHIAFTPDNQCVNFSVGYDGDAGSYFRAAYSAPVWFGSRFFFGGDLAVRGRGGSFG